MRSMGAHCDGSECRCTVAFIRTASTKDRTDKEWEGVYFQAITSGCTKAGELDLHSGIIWRLAIVPFQSAYSFRRQLLNVESAFIQMPILNEYWATICEQIALTVDTLCHLRAAHGPGAKGYHTWPTAWSEIVFEKPSVSFEIIKSDLPMSEEWPSKDE